MYIDDIRNIDEGLYKEELSCDLFEDVDYALNINKGHLERHLVDKNEALVEDLRRIIEENKIAGTGSFINRETAIQSIQDGIYYDIDNVVNWMMKSKNEFDNENKYYIYEKTVELTKEGPNAEYIGTGMTRDLSIVESRAVRFILERDSKGESGYKFFLKTAYPDNSKEYSRVIGKLTKESILENELYEFKNEYQKAAFIYNDFNNTKINFFERTSGDKTLVLEYGDKNDKYVAYIHEDTKSVKIYRDNGKKRPINSIDTPPKFLETIDKCSDMLGVKRTLSLDERMEKAKKESKTISKNISRAYNFDR